MKEKIGFVKSFRDGLSQYAVSTYSAAGAFYFFLSIVPITILLCMLLPFTPVSEELLLELLTPLLPDSLTELFAGVLSDVYTGSATAFSLSVLITIWSAAKAVMALMRGLDEMHGVTAQAQPRVIVRRLRAAVYTLALLLMVLGSLLLMVLGGRISSLLQQLWPAFEPPAILSRLWRYLAAMAFLFVMFTILYKWAPNCKLRFVEQFPGAIFASVGWVVFSMGFSLYLSLSGGFSTYGRIAAVVVAMMWMYWCVYIILIGAYLNIFLSERRLGSGNRRSGAGDSAG